MNDEQQSNDIDEENVNAEHDVTLPSKPLSANGIFPYSIVTCANLEDYPESYRSNSTKEELILTYVENFRRQYHHLYRDRKPLFLTPLNECSIPKFVCTTIRPTMLPYSELTDWNLAANFITDHLNYNLLEPPYELVRYLYVPYTIKLPYQPRTFWSPTKILADQQGNCFDYANLLCSLLIGAGYDAYIVSGYATREICYMDTTRLPNPYESVEQWKSQCQKYAVKPEKDFTSKYDAYMHQRHLSVIQEEENRLKIEEDKRIAEIERPLSDPLEGIRVHAWILILPGKRDISETFYIEPTTGYAKTTNDSEYLGIESVWNHRNLWVNMQDCSTSCKTLQFDLDDQARWECMFPYSTNLIQMGSDNTTDEDGQLDRKRTLITSSNRIDWFEKMKFYFTNPLHLPVSNITAISYYHNYSDRIKSELYKQYYSSTIPDITSKETVSKEIDLPLSWVNPLDITSKDFQKRYPNSRKTYYYKKACVEKYAPYSMKDGLVLKVTEFNDYDFQQSIYVTYCYEHRHDKLDKREHDVADDMVYEKYRPGRKDHLKEYSYNFEPMYNRTMIYYHKSRLDGLFKRYETTSELTDYFIDHDHLLTYRKVVFESSLKKTHRNTPRSIISITEKFHRNTTLHSNDDIQEIIYAIKDNKFIITYHRDINHITSSIRTYIKPSNWNDKTFVFKWNDDLQETYQVDEDFKQMSKRDLYYTMIKLIEQENEVIKQIRKEESEIRDLQSSRRQEELSSDLEVSIYDIDRNEKSKIYKNLLEQKANENKHKKDDDELDYLAPYLAAIGDPERINAQIAEQLRFAIKRDVENQSVYRANLIQSRYETEIEDLINKQQRYQINMTKQDEIECQQAKFRLEILEQRLKEHQDLSKDRYHQLEFKLQEDIRLKEPYIIR